MSKKVKAIKRAMEKREKFVQNYKESYSKTEIIRELSRFELKGNIIDQGWFTHLVNGKGKVQSNAIFILSEIVYWYRPQLVFDETTGNIKALKAKFHGDMLQKSYDQLAKKFGLSEKQVKDACKFLEEKNLIVLDFRTITLKNGRKINNVLYIGLNIKELKKISILMNDSIEVIDAIKDNADIKDQGLPVGIDNTSIEHPVNKNVNRVLTKKLIGYKQKSKQPINKNVNTNTENINTESIYTESIYTINQSINRQIDKNEKDNSKSISKKELDEEIINAGFKSCNDLVYDLGLNKSFFDEPLSEWIDCVKKAISEMYYYETTKIRGVEIDRYDVITKLQNLNIDMVISAIYKVIESSKLQEIIHPTAFIKTALFNEIDEFYARLQAKLNFDLEGQDVGQVDHPRTRFHNFKSRTEEYTKEEINRKVEEIAARRKKEYLERNRDMN